MLLIAAGARAEGPSGRLDVESLWLSSPAFPDYGELPRRYTCDGSDQSPPLQWGGVPNAAQSLALIVEDLSRPDGQWIHWLVFNLAPDSGGLAAGAGRNLSGNATQGRNGWGRIGYDGPCPDDGRPRYVFRLHALDTALRLRRPDAGALRAAMQGHVLESARLVVHYRPPAHPEEPPGDGIPFAP